MDADLQHDETILPVMIEEIEKRDVDVVVATRYDAGGSTGGWDESRKAISRFATMASRTILRHHVSDPMSGFFMINRQTLDTVVHNLSGLGFKILLDILVTGKNHLRVSEVPYHFRDRYAGESKFDKMAVWEYGMLLADKMVGRFVPVRFLAFSIVGGLGVFVHMGVLTLMLKVLGLSFITSQSAATGTAMIFNFVLNNILTYRDRRLTGWAWFMGLISFMLTCSVGALANIGIATFLFANRTQWIIAAIAGILVGVVWNYAITQLYTWRKK
jgi:dolichol-phosphate mannosyltransferase